MLAGRKTTGKLTGGGIKFGGVKPTTTLLRRWTGYVEQFDTLVPNLTVAENLMLVRAWARARHHRLRHDPQPVAVLVPAL